MTSPNFKLKLLTLISKLSDRDTFSSAAKELDSISAALTAATFPTFLSCILSIDSNDKPSARKHSLHLLSSLSHRHSLSPSSSKIISFVARRLRDPDSSVRSQCVETVYNLTLNAKRSNFSGTLLKGLSEMVFTEQELNSQMGSALCLAAVVDGMADPDPDRLGRSVLPRMERLVKSEGFKAKSAGLVVIGSVIGVGGVRGYGGIGGLVKSLLGFLSCGDWAARKAAAEALEKLAVVEREGVAEFKEGCLKVFEGRRFDKVKAVREVMNRMIEAWKQVPDVADETTPPPGSVGSSSIEDASDGRYRPGSKAVLMRMKTVTNSSTPPDNSLANTARTRIPFRSSDKQLSTGTIQKAGHKNPTSQKVENVAVVSNNAGERKVRKPETRRALFTKSSDKNMVKYEGLNSGSNVTPCHTENTVAMRVSNGQENHNSNHKECEDLSLIRNQLVQIERQQSSLLDILQRFIGTSQNGMRSLETRVYSLELSLDKISYDLALSRMEDSKRTRCLPLPGADLLSPKFWRRQEGHRSMPKLFNNTRMSRRMTNAETSENRGGFIINPLADIHSESRENRRVKVPSINFKRSEFLEDSYNI